MFDVCSNYQGRSCDFRGKADIKTREVLATKRCHVSLKAEKTSDWSDKLIK